MQTNGPNGHQHEVSEKRPPPGAFPCRLDMELCAYGAKRWVDLHGKPATPVAVHQPEATNRKRVRIENNTVGTPHPRKSRHPTCPRDPVHKKRRPPPERIVASRRQRPPNPTGERPQGAYRFRTRACGGHGQCPDGSSPGAHPAGTARTPG